MRLSLPAEACPDAAGGGAKGSGAGKGGGESESIGGKWREAGWRVACMSPAAVREERDPMAGKAGSDRRWDRRTSNTVMTL